MLTAQQIFDKVVNHLRTQGRAAHAPNGTGCMYRNDEGLSCAVGCLIPDSHYRPEFDDPGLIAQLIDKQPDTWTGYYRLGAIDTVVYTMQYVRPFADALLAGGVDVTAHIDLLEELQRFHDGEFVEYNERAASVLARIAFAHQLDPSSTKL